MSLLKRWVLASHAIGKIGADPLGGYIAYEIQSLGRTDIRLREEYRGIEALFRQPEEEPSFALDDYLDLSRLWVLGAYELVRSLDGCIAAGLWSPPADIADQMKKVKRMFAAVRIPLAKFEPAGGRKATPGDLIAEPVFVPREGAAWNIGASSPEIVTRAELADALLELLEAARRVNPALPDAGA